MAKAPAYTVNLDPAVQHLPYGSNIDIRKTVKYKEVMKQYVHRVVAGREFGLLCSWSRRARCTGMALVPMVPS